jgi:hypothetical protein
MQARDRERAAGFDLARDVAVVDRALALSVMKAALGSCL